jgi:thiol-disulfide isomerase/thioredoxin
MLVVMTALAACAPNAKDEREPERPIAVGERVPDLTVRTLDGDTARIAEGQPVTLVHLWATWCGPCRLEFREIEAVQREYAPRGLRIIAVSVDDGDDDVVGIFAREWGASFQIGRDPDGEIRRLYRGAHVPYSYLISADGRLIARQYGTLRGADGAMRAAIERALREAPPHPPSREVRRASG